MEQAAVHTQNMHVCILGAEVRNGAPAKRIALYRVYMNKYNIRKVDFMHCVHCLDHLDDLGLRTVCAPS
ncbi:uncharacterized protein PHALS_08760 [Plasmopara halstedii]|uniref:Uncharacterized protein n=1 Tax=Plasmopara halstedii TaxID=4781 RepID=A0A0P1ADW7_PLAHL|nr:uncharacterized protein PHALS_08760 [Plasmopara halstedii]CEG38701.1 hypothetical protein PHALS_08760 [Plasmopara halstedii]|eukprot:XP_024575070.1 hypothetical protein PHALS_08760 [Plasmopara halstedii]